VTENRVILFPHVLRKKTKSLLRISAHRAGSSRPEAPIEDGEEG
jgi:hypothetical protein